MAAPVMTPMNAAALLSPPPPTYISLLPSMDTAWQPGTQGTSARRVPNSSYVAASLKSMSSNGAPSMVGTFTKPLASTTSVMVASLSACQEAKRAYSEVR
jgi:hypothetical protein